MKKPGYIICLLMFLGFSSLVQRSSANVVGTDAQNFNTITSGLDFVTVQSSETLKPGLINLGLFLNYAVNTLPYFETAAPDRRSFNDSLLGGDFNLGVGLLQNWDVGLSLPHVLNQTVKSDSGYYGGFSKTGNTEIRISSKFRLSGDDSGGVALVASMGIDRIQDNPYTGAGAGPTTNLEIAADTTYKKVALGFNLGHRWRNPGSPLAGSPIQPMRNQIIYSAAGSYLFPASDTKLIVEIFGGQPSEKTASEIFRSQSSLEALAGVKHDLTSQLSVHGGVATELANAIASPDWRIYTGLNYTFGPVFKKPLVHLEVVTNPDPPPPPKTEKYLTRSILFEFDSDEVDPSSFPALEELVAILQKPPMFKKLVVEGHTDSVGREDYNLKLSERRAAAIRKILHEKFKVDGDKITSQGFGESKPIADNGNFQGRQQNRRVEFSVSR